MQRNFSRYVPMIFLIIIIVLFVAAGVSIFRAITGGTKQTKEADTTVTTTEELLKTDADRSVTMRLRSEIVADEDFRTYSVTISSSKREFKRNQGYRDDQLVHKTYSNNIRAYEEFVHALNKAGLTRGESTLEDDVRGVCATGILFEFETQTAGAPTGRWWTSTCKASAGTLDADADYLRELFLAQVPDAVQYIGNDHPGANR